MKCTFTLGQVILSFVDNMLISFNTIYTIIERSIFVLKRILCREVCIVLSYYRGSKDMRFLACMLCTV